MRTINQFGLENYYSAFNKLNSQSVASKISYTDNDKYFVAQIVFI